MIEPGSGVEVPHAVRLHLGRAAVQMLASGVGTDVLHLKGDAVSSELRPVRSPGTDIDILVRPSQLAALDVALRGSGWSLYTTFEGGSPFAHAQTYLHEMWGYLDLHRHFPGIGVEPSTAFDHLWQDRLAMDFGGVACAVPHETAQAAILILNAARARAQHRDDVNSAWIEADAVRRAAIEAEIDALDARLAFDAAIGELEAHRGERGYLLWRAISQNGTRFDEWRGRLRAAPSCAARLAVLMRAPRVNVEHLAMRLGHRPSRREIAGEFVARPIRGVRELWRRRGGAR